MTETKVTIISLDGEYAMIRADQQGGCGRCHEAGGCGGNNLVQMMCNSPREYRVLNSVGAVVGEQVVVTVADGAVGRSAILTYGVPLAFLFFGALFGDVVLGSNLATVLGAITGLVISGFFIAGFQKKLRGNGVFQPVILKRAGNGS